MIVSCSEQTLTACRKDDIDASRVRVIYNGLVPDRLTSTPKEDVRQLLGLPQKTQIAAIVGSLIQRKGHDILFSAIDLLAERFPNFHLAVIGEGPDGPALRASAVSPHIHFLGERANVGGLLQGGINFLVLPSRGEAAPLTILEGALFGIPTIASNVGGIAEMIQNGVTGLLVPAGDPVALAEAMASLLEAPDMRQQMGAAARKLFDAKFHVDIMAAQFAAVYSELIHARPGGLRSVPRRLFQVRKMMR